MRRLLPSAESIMFYFTSPPKPSPKATHVSEDIEQATPLPRATSRGAVGQTSSRDGDGHHHCQDARQRRNHPLELEHSSSSDHIDNIAHSHNHAAAPASGRLPLLVHNNTINNKTVPPSIPEPEPVLLHPILKKIPLQFRFGAVGVVSNILFMIAYNLAVTWFEQKYTPSTIYGVVYFIYIPIGHLLVSLLVFGWPENYLPSLMSNFPIGLTAIAIGSGLTAYCDYYDFNNRVEEYIRDYFTFSRMPSRPDEAPSSEFYTSIVVLLVTSLWTYILSVYVNATPAKSDKKEL